MRHQDKIKLTESEREQLNKIVRQGQHKAQIIRNAQIILKSVAGWTDDQVAEAYCLSKRTVIRVRNQFRQAQQLQTALLVALGHKPRSGAPVTFGPKQQALVIAKACTPPPPGQVRWTLELLQDHLRLELGQPISRESVRQILKKTNSNLTKKSNGAYLP